MAAPRRLVIFATLVVMIGVLVGVGSVGGEAGLYQFSEFEGNQSTPVAPPDFNSTERLVLTGTVTAGSGSPSVDPGLSTTLAFEQLRAEYDNHLLDARISRADNSSVEVDLLRTDVRELQEDLERAHETERRSLEAFQEDEIDEGTFLSRLALESERSKTVQFRLEHLSEVARQVSSPPVEEDVVIIRGEISQMDMETTTLDGPVRTAALDAIRGENRLEQDILVQASRDGHTIATIIDGVYLRESLVNPNRPVDADGSFTDPSQGRDRAAELYPWTFEHSVGIQDLLRGGTYRASVDHAHGTTTTFVDAGSELAFREIHELDLITMQTVTALSTTEGMVDIELHRTYAGGPAYLVLSEAGSDAALGGATVSIDGTTVGETDASGITWFVTPDERFELRVMIGDSTIEREIELLTANQSRG